jgi:3-deoxy-D-manno-octulosonate 8-phosphate phosphatase (KDO 8-P phosphatase)
VNPIQRQSQTPETARATAADKARSVRMLIMDVDGVLTDGRAFYGGPGIEGVFFNIQDGTGITYLHRSGIRTALITGREIQGVEERARVLGISDVVQGAKVKLEAYETVRQRAGLADGEIAYVGDDLPDIPVMRRVGLAVAVPNAAPEVLEVADLVTQRAGGHGAVRELAEFVLKTQGKWDQILTRYRQ